MTEAIETMIIECRQLKKDRFYIGFLTVFWLVWAPITARVTWLVVDEFSWLLLVWLIFGYAGTILIPLSLLSANGREILTTTTDGIEVLYDHRVIKRKVFISKDNIESVTLERFDSGSTYSESGVESTWTLNIIQKKGLRWKRVMIATLAHPEEKNRIYADLVRVLTKFGFSFQQKNDYEVRPLGPS
jgi:hypothetical protein